MSPPTAPVCECHAEPMLWHKDPRRKAGGSWRCRDRVAASHARYARTPKGQARDARYRATGKGVMNEFRWSITRSTRAHLELREDMRLGSTASPVSTGSGMSKLVWG